MTSSNRGSVVFKKLFSAGDRKREEARKSLSADFWPRTEITRVLEQRYSQVEHLQDDNGFALYGVVDNDLRFVVALVTVPGNETLISEVGFIARFSNFKISPNQLEALNRNLHLSLAAFDQAGDIHLIGGVKAQGAFNSGAFTLVLDSWRRDLLLVIMVLNEKVSFMDAFPAAKLDAVQKFALNTKPKATSDGQETAAPEQDMLSRFMSTTRASFAPCADCDGRGKRGLIARTCDGCDGAGIIRSEISR